LFEEKSISTLLTFCKKKGILLIADETFIEFGDRQCFLVEKLKTCPNLVLIRSFTKFYALPGLRMGYGMLHPKWIQRIAPYLPPWSVNGLAQRIGVEVLKDYKFASKTRDFIRREREFLSRKLMDLPVEVFDSNTNFLLLRLKSNDPNLPGRLYQNLLNRGILIRNCGNFTGLDERYFRIAVKKRKENRSLLSAMRSIFQEYFLTL